MKTSNKLIKKYHSLNGKIVTRKKLVDFSRELFDVLPEENIQIEEIYYNISKILLKYPKLKKFEIKVKGTTAEMLNGIPFMPHDEIEESDILGKGVTSDDIYNMVTDRIIDYIDQNDELIWYNGRDSKKGKDKFIFLPLPINYSTGKHYRGINTIILGYYPVKNDKGLVKFKPIEDDRLFWMSFKQIKKAGGKLKKGSAANQAIFYSWIFKYDGKNITEQKYKTLSAKFNCSRNRGSEDCKKLLKIPFLRYYSVYNERDIEGINFDKKRAELKKKSNVIEIETDAQKIDAAEQIISNMPLKPVVVEKHIGKGESPAYYPTSDKVIMPLKDQYENVAIWYGTAFHELTHSTGHESRVGRVGITNFDRFGSPQYSFEELVAELGSAFLNSESGIFFHTIKKNSAYIKGWAKSVKKILKENNKAIFIAAGQAQKAADYVLDRDTNGTPKYLKKIAPKVKGEKIDPKPTKKPKRKVTPKKIAVKKPIAKKTIVKKPVVKKRPGSKPKVQKVVVPKPKVNPKTRQIALFGGKKKSIIKVEEAEQGTSTLKGVDDVPAPLINGLKSVNNYKNKVIEDFEYYKISGDIAELLGDVEIKPKESVAVTLDAPQGAGKTRVFFQFVNEFAGNGYKVLFVSAEEHPESALFRKKLDQYITPQNQNNVYAIDSTNYEEISSLIPSFDVIVIDSWNKILQKNKGIDFDHDLRKKFDGKLIFTIFQRTQDGKMRGGSNAQFDGDIILKIVKHDNFKENYVIADKNRYQSNDIHEIKYNIFYQKLMIEKEAEEVPATPTTEEKIVLLV